MENKKIKVYIYTRVSTAMQIDGYSLDAQRTRMRAFAEFLCLQSLVCYTFIRKPAAKQQRVPL